MLFNSFEFWIFFAVVLVGFYSVPYRAGKVLLLGASYLFYMWWNPRFIALILASTIVDYVLGILLETAQPRRRKPLLIVSIVVNLGFLGFFKYYNFFVGSLATLLGWPADSLALNIVLPVGISFYTFASLSYTIDVYRRKTAAVRNFIDYAFFIAFFPHLIAGPILRAKQFLPQVQQWQRPTAATVNRGIALILSGLIKKMVFADRFAIVSDAYFNNVAAHPGWLAAWSGAFAFAMQLFFDFSGYTDIARGCAKLFGFEFPLNFQRPYLATNVVEFWQRWHITLSSWVRDYLFLPLTRGTRSRLKIYFALALTMVLLGLWHGASWTFVVWGVYFGVFVVVYRIFQQKFDPGSLGTVLWQRIFHPFKVTATFLLVIAAAAFFRPKSLHDMVLVLSSYVDWRHTGTSVLTIGTLVLFFVSFLLAILEERRRFITRLSLAPAYVQVPAFVSVFLVLELFSVTERVPFIYFQF
ncbi:MAG TPA: MBOAT family O-acyltransferase [Chthoniobacterales bacterium]